MTIVQKVPNNGCGCDSVSGAGLISVDHALAEIARKTRPVAGSDTVPLPEAVGRVLIDPVRALGMVPPFANAAMDGYAINTLDLTGDGPWDLPVTGRVAAGETPRSLVVRKSAVQILTGAPVPDGANAVVMLEHVQRTADGIRVTNRVAPRTHIRAAGEDMSAGKIIVPAGRALSPADIAAGAAGGHGHLTVRRALRVALLVTGDEVCRLGDPRGPAGIWDVNTPMLAAAIASPAVALCEVHLAADTRPALGSQLADLAKSVDLIVTTGGISVGEEDHVKPALLDLGASIDVSGVALKPGKPVSFGRFNGTFWLGLPGNPLSAFLTWHLLGKPICRAMIGQTQVAAPRRPVTLSRPLRHKPGRCELRLACLSGFDTQGRQIVDFANATHSGRVASLPQMDGVLVIPAEVETLPQGAQAEFQLF